jgi:hypothetical protein
MGEILPEPGEAEIDVIELQDRSPRGPLDQDRDIPLHPGVPEVGAHEKIVVDPLFAVVLAEDLQSVVLSPIIRDILVRRIDVGAPCSWIEPAPLVVRLVIGGAAIDVAEDIPQQG